MPLLRRFRRRGVWVFVLGLGSVGLLALACGETLVQNNPPDGDASATDGLSSDVDGVSDSNPDAPVKDAGIDVGDFDLEERPACPRPAAGVPCTGVALGVNECKATLLFDAPTTEFPHGIVADRRHVFWLAQPVGPDGGVEGYNGIGTAVLRRVDRATLEVVELARGQVLATTLFAYGPNLFWGAENASGQYAIRMLRKDAKPCTASGCSQPINVANGVGRPFHIGALSSQFLFVLAINGALTRIAVDSSSNDIVGTTTTFPGFAVGDGVVYAGGGFQNGVERFAPSGTQLPNLGNIPDGSLGGLYLATTCGAVYSRGSDNRVLSIDAGAEGGTFAVHTSLPTPFQVYSNASDERFLFYGAANTQGLRRIDTTVLDASAIEIAKGSVWGIAVTDDAIIYGEHGGGPSDTTATVGSIFSIAK